MPLSILERPFWNSSNSLFYGPKQFGTSNVFFLPILFMNKLNSLCLNTTLLWEYAQFDICANSFLFYSLFSDQKCLFSYSIGAEIV